MLFPEPQAWAGLVRPGKGGIWGKQEKLGEKLREKVRKDIPLVLWRTQS